MTDVLQTNIFFVITSIAIIVISILLVITLVYVIRVIRDLSHVSKIVREQSDQIVQDVSSAREQIISKAGSLKGILMFFLKRMAPKQKRKKDTSI